LSPRAWRLARWTLAGVAALLALAGAVLLPLAGTEAGSAWLLARVPGLTVDQPQGRLFGGPFAAARVDIALGARRVQIERLAWTDARWAWRPHEGAWFGLAIGGAHAERVNIGAAPATAEPAAEPTQLRLPFALALDALRVTQLQFDGAVVASELSAQIELGHERGSVHRVPQWRLRTPRALVSGSASVGADAPFPLDAQLRLDAGENVSPRWNATLDAKGPLAAIALRAQLSSHDAQGARADAQATLSPFAAWPLSTLQANLSELDLAALVEGAPRTRLAGRARIDTRGLDQPVTAQLAFTNAESGRWDQQRLPIVALELELAGRADQRQRVAIQRFELRLPGDAGRVNGQGEWNGDAATLDIALQGVRPAALDARAPAMTLGGTLALRLAGLPAPDGSRPAAATQQLQSTLALDGRLDARRAEAVRVRGNLKAERSGALWRAELEGIEAQAGAAQLRGRLAAAREATLWRWGSQGELSRFDPAAWWTGAPAALLNGRWSADLSAPPTLVLPLQDANGWLALRGQARIELQDSRLAGVPLQGVISADGRQPGWSIDADARAAGNRISAQGQLAPRAADDRWRTEIDAPALAALRSLLSAIAPTAKLDGLDGTLTGQAQASGRWPALRSNGSLRGSALRAGPWSAQRLGATWQAGPDRDAPLALTLEGERLAEEGTLTLESLRGTVEGSLAAHKIALDGLTPLRPPAWTDTLLGAAAGRAKASRVRLRADGRWLPGAHAAPLAGRWSARVSELDARGSDAGLPWLAAQDLALELQLDAQGRPLQARVASGRAQMLGASVVLRESRWQAGARAPFGLEADLEPLLIAPWLARWQPAAGFGGDLRVKGRAQVRRAESSFSADVVLERADGDLAITTEGVTQPLGLSDLRLALAAERGTWHFTQAVAGANLGVLVGAQSMRLDPAATWPAPTTPMQGVLEWQVADLGAWAPLAPPGWRLAGRLRTSAAIGGRFGAPEIEGRMEGSGLGLRNLLQGVDLRDGELALSLRGEDARIERFVFKGGDGELRVTGGATLGAEPRARLQLKAERFRLLGRTDRRIVTSGEATLALDAKSLALDGRLGIDEGLIDVSRADAPSLDADVTVRGGKHRTPPPAPDTEEAAAPPRAAAAARDVRVAVQLDLGQQLRLRGRGLDTRLTGRLAISAPGGRLALNGSVNAVDGTYAAYGQKLEIERGVLRFVGAPENPRLDILAVRPNLDVKVGVMITGGAQSPRVRLASEPEMSDYDKLSWLVLGRASDGLARTDTALLQRAALALLAGEGQSADAALLANLGLDEFSVRQNESGEVRDTVVTLGKQLSRRWYVGYEHSVNNTTGTWQLIYRAARRFTLRAQSGAENSLDAIWVWRWN
jgi:translocation and assembly module TamB